MGKWAHLYESRRWRAERKAFLQRNPLCAMCMEAGKLKAATVVDHVKPHRGDLGLFWDQGNWRSSCKPCHDGAKQQVEKSGTLRGTDREGVPLDPRHHWNR